MPSVTLDLSSYERDLKGYLDELRDSAIVHQKSLKTHPPDEKAISRVLEGIPGVNPKLISAVKNRDGDAISELDHELFEMSMEALKKDFEEYQKIRDAMKEVMALRESLFDEQSEESIEKSYLESYQTNLASVRKQGGVVSKTVQESIGRLVSFHTYPVTLSASFDPDRSLDKAPGGYEVTLGHHHLGFTLFVTQSGTIGEVDDVLEGGDEDFFHDPQEQADYFSLINEIRKPGSTSKGSRITLYTARPVKDRSRYEDATSIPVNIFLASTEPEAYGLARELGGNEIRDVWKVVMNSKHLVQTLNAGNVQHYQTVGTGTVPVDRMVLVDPGESANRVASRFLSSVLI